SDRDWSSDVCSSDLVQEPVWSDRCFLQAFIPGEKRPLYERLDFLEPQPPSAEGFDVSQDFRNALQNLETSCDHFGRSATAVPDRSEERRVGKAWREA